MRISPLPALLAFLLSLAPACAEDALANTSVALPTGEIAALTFSQSLRQLYLSAGDAVLVLDDKGQEINRLPAHGAASVVLAPALRRGFIVNSDGDLTVFDPGRSIAVAHVLIPVDHPGLAVFEPRTTQLFIAGESDRKNQLAAIDAGGVRETGTVELPEKPASLQADGAGHIYLTFPASDEIGVLDARRREVVKTWPVGGACHQPGPAALDEIHHRLYFACGNGQLVAMDTDYGQIETSLPASAALDALAYDANHDQLYAADPGGSVLVAGSGQDGKFAILTALTTDAPSQFLALDGRDDRLYLTARTAMGASLLIVPTGAAAP